MTNLKDDITKTRRLTIHPGAYLHAEFLEPLGISASAMAGEIGVPANRLTEMVSGRRNLTADTALRLAKRLKTSPEFWMNLQSLHDLSKAVLAARGRHRAA